MSAQHTPGPWQVERGPVSRNLCVMSATTWICGQLQSDNETSIDTAEVIANARLIAAAPDMLAACKSALEFYDAQPKPHQAGEAAILDGLKAALTKATGAA